VPSDHAPARIDPVTPAGAPSPAEASSSDAALGPVGSRASSATNTARRLACAVSTPVVRPITGPIEALASMSAQRHDVDPRRLVLRRHPDQSLAASDRGDRRRARQAEPTLGHPALWGPFLDRARLEPDRCALRATMSAI